MKLCSEMIAIITTTDNYVSHFCTCVQGTNGHEFICPKHSIETCSNHYITDIYSAVIIVQLIKECMYTLTTGSAPI